MGSVARLSDQLKLRTVSDQSSNNPSNSWAGKLAGLSELDVSYDANDGILWKRMKHAGRASASMELLTETLEVLSAAKAAYAEDVKADRKSIKYMVTTSMLSGVFLLGGDLPFFAQMIASRDRASLMLYATQCINVIHAYANGTGTPAHSIALVQGDALGGGFEIALANDVIIAEKSAKFGLPEVLFNLFPGMGAYTLLARKLDVVRAERMILGGKIYTADEMHEMGLVDVVAEDGEGEVALYDYIERHNRLYTSRQSVIKARQIAKPVSYDELKAIVEVWVDAAMSLTPADLRKMQLVTKAQDRRLGFAAKASEPQQDEVIQQLTA